MCCSQWIWFHKSQEKVVVSGRNSLNMFHRIFRLWRHVVKNPVWLYSLLLQTCSSFIVVLFCAYTWNIKQHKKTLSRYLLVRISEIYWFFGIRVSVCCRHDQGLGHIVPFLPPIRASNEHADMHGCPLPRYQHLRTHSSGWQSHARSLSSSGGAAVGTPTGWDWRLLSSACRLNSQAVGDGRPTMGTSGRLNTDSLYAHLSRGCFRILMANQLDLQQGMFQNVYHNTTVCKVAPKASPCVRPSATDANSMQWYTPPVVTLVFFRKEKPTVELKRLIVFSWHWCMYNNCITGCQCLSYLME